MANTGSKSITQARGSVWVWWTLWGLSLLAGMGLLLLYSWLPADGATGDMESFEAGGFRIQWQLAEREAAPVPGDLIVQAGGHTVDEWLQGATRGSVWRTGGTVLYQIQRQGQVLTRPVHLAPVPITAILARWWPQFLASLAVWLVGSFVFWKRPHEPAARMMMLFCISVAVQTWGDAYNIQYSTLPWRWPFWIQFYVEYATFIIIYASVLNFALLFPIPHPVLKRFPRLTLLALYVVHPVVVLLALASAPTLSQGLRTASHASWLVAAVQVTLAIAAGIRSIYTVRDPVSRAQVRWIVWGAGMVMAVALPLYILPLALTGQTPIPHPIVMLFTGAIPFVFAIPILRYRLFDIEIIIHRSLVYGTLTALLIGFYALLVRVLTIVASMVVNREQQAVAMFLAALAVALAFGPLRRRVQLAIDRTFYHSKLDYQQLLEEMSERLATSIVLDQLNRLLTVELPRRLQISWAGLVVLDPAGRALKPANGDRDLPPLAVDHPLFAYLGRRGKPLLRLAPPSDLPPQARAYLDQNQIELSIPLTVDTKQVGLYNLGLKRSGDVFNRDEIRLLHLIGQQAAVAVENSRLLEQAQQEIGERKRVEAQIKQSLAEKELLLKEIHHRVKNNLQVISSLLYLQSKQIRDDDTLSVFMESQHRIRTMALVHESLYQTGNLAQVDFAAYIRDLVGYLSRAYRIDTRRVTVNVEVGQVRLRIDLAVPCGLIVNELVSNALKHAFPNGQEGEIRVGLDQEPGGQCLLTVTDTGLGLPLDIDLENTRSLGLRLVQNLVDQIEGTIELRRGPGTTFAITFPQVQDEAVSLQKKKRGREL